MLLEPDDAHNRALLASARPPGWTNPIPSGRYNLVVLGGGTAGLVTAAAAAGLGAKVALVERHLLGGDCLNYGCVPSKTLLASAKMAAHCRRAGDYGVRLAGGVEVDFPSIMERVRRVRAQISPNDSAERFKSLGVDVFLGPAKFVSTEAVEVDERRLRFAKAVIATGARAAVPSIPGLAQSGFLTNETIFNLVHLPARLLILGGGPIGVELAQAFARLGSRVDLVERGPRILSREDPQASEAVRRALLADGVALHLETSVTQVSGDAVLGRRATLQPKEGSPRFLDADAILVALGRAPNVAGMGLESAEVDFDERSGVVVDDFLRTTNPSVYAAGDVCSAAKFTHAADFMARAVVQNALFLGRKRLTSLKIPRCTYTEPEIAQVGLSESAAAGKIPFRAFTRPLREVDRAITDGEGEGFVKILTAAGSDKILGATIVGPHAGDLISEISVAMAGEVGLGRLASVIHPYPTLAEAIRQCGDAFNRTRLTPSVKSLMGKWLEWRRG